eukprot:TRINITY_DN17085_c0_g1_i2.p1 TRINITY_DN17085_c0_g1~~TRINITY_DN17085_c0_g1_i2.p1  ORF type:complete len:113 (+),score=11.06 TRINITY_DN17085_c0_g1_i2:299-637(+)
MMKPASEEVELALNSISIKDPLVPIVSNVSALAETSSVNIKRLLVEQTYSTVKWMDCVEYCKNNGIESYLEIGPKKSLSNLITQTHINAKLSAITSLAEVKQFLVQYKEPSP